MQTSEELRAEVLRLRSRIRHLKSQLAQLEEEDDFRAIREVVNSDTPLGAYLREQLAFQPES